MGRIKIEDGGLSDDGGASNTFPRRACEAFLTPGSPYIPRPLARL